MTAKTVHRMSRPDDARALRSREALRQSLLALVEERPFDAISIREITTHAGVSYPVFFRRYRTKDQLLEDIATEEVRSLLGLTLPIFNTNMQEESLRTFCGYVNERRVLWTRLLTGGAASSMREEFKRIPREIGETQSNINPWLPRELAASFVVGSLFEILSCGCRNPTIIRSPG